MNQKELEFKRQQLQVLLDSQKDAKSRNVLGQFATPYTLASEIAEVVLKLIPGQEIRFLEPSIGTGVFYSALTKYVQPVSAVGYEIDSHYFTPTQELWNGQNIELYNTNFLLEQPNKKFNLILANPPYSRHHHIDTEIKTFLRQKVLDSYGIDVSGLSGLYCYFMILSTLWLENDGLSVWLIPSEFLSVKYGKCLRQFLTQHVDLLSIHRYSEDDLQFSDALVSSAIVIFRNRKPTPNKVNFTMGSSLNSPTQTQSIDKSELCGQEKWMQFFENIHQRNSENQDVKLGEFFKVSRGISTGNNSFFILTESEVESLSLPRDFLTPILPSPRYLDQSVIERVANGCGESQLNYYLSCPLPIEEICNKYPTLYDYIKAGEDNEVNKGANCSKRNPWYNGESRQSSPLYMTYMGRGENYDRMFRFILNKTDAIVNNSYLILYPRQNYRFALGSSEICKEVWKILNNIPKDRLMKCGRTYGGGLIKLEPKELESLPIPELKSILTPNQKGLFD